MGDVVCGVGFVEPGAAERPAGAGGEIEAEADALGFGEGVREEFDPGVGEERDEAIFVAARAVDRCELETAESGGVCLFECGGDGWFIGDVAEPPPARPRAGFGFDLGPGEVVSGERAGERGEGEDGGEAEHGGVDARWCLSVREAKFGYKFIAAIEGNSDCQRGAAVASCKRETIFPADAQPRAARPKNERPTVMPAHVILFISSACARRLRSMARDGFGREKGRA